MLGRQDVLKTSSQPSARPLKSAQRALEARAASGVSGTIAARMQLSWFYAKPGAAVVDVDMEIDPAATKMHGKLHDEFTLPGVVYPGGRIGRGAGYPIWSSWISTRRSN